MITFFASLALTGVYILYKCQNSLLYYPDIGFGRSPKLNPRSLTHPNNRNSLIGEDI
jgi:hypothetical protein